MIEALLNANGFHEADVFLNQPHIHNELLEVADRARRGVQAVKGTESSGSWPTCLEEPQAVGHLPSGARRASRNFAGGEFIIRTWFMCSVQISELRERQVSWVARLGFLLLPISSCPPLWWARPSRADSCDAPEVVARRSYGAPLRSFPWASIKLS
jgi:hypothetical protein